MAAARRGRALRALAAAADARPRPASPTAGGGGGIGARLPARPPGGGGGGGGGAGGGILEGFATSVADRVRPACLLASSFADRAESDARAFFVGSPLPASRRGARMIIITVLYTHVAEGGPWVGVGTAEQLTRPA